MATFTLISPFAETRNGTNAADSFFVWGGNDTISALGGDDRIFDQGIAGDSGGLFSGDDVLFGGSGNDTFIAGDGLNILNGGSGTDTVSYSFADRGVSVNLATGLGQGEGTDSLFSIENVNGSVNNDVIIGNSSANRLFGDRGRDTIDGGSSNDVLLGGVGNDVLNGGTGTDTVDYSYLSSVGRVVVALGENGAAGTASEFDAGSSPSGPVPVFAGTDTVRSIENVVGSAGGDTITGNSGDNTLAGGGGADRIIGGRGADTLTGGTGGDVFVFRSIAEDTNAAGRFDTITDFVHGADRIDLSAFDGNPLLAGQQDLVFVGNGAGGMGRIDVSFDAARNVTVVEANTSLDLSGIPGFSDPADFRVELRGNVTLTAGDFIV